MIRLTPKPCNRLVHPVARAWFAGTALQLSTIGCALAQAFTVTPSPIVMPASGDAINVTLAPSGGTAPYQYILSAGRLPAGVSLSSAGVLSGTLAETSPAFTITVADNRGAEVDVLAKVITVTPPPAPFTVGTSPGAVLSPAGGSGPYLFAVAPGGSMPPGLTLNADGSLSGTPTTAGTYTVPIVVTDSVGASVTVNVTFTVNAAPVVLSIAAPPVMTVGTPSSITLAASGGSAPYQFTLTSGTLPAGLTLNADGTVTGTPSAAGSTTVTITVTDNAGANTPNTVTFTVNAASVVLSIAAPPAMTVGSPVNMALAASGGSAPYQFALTSGTLPAGLTLNADGTVTGTPSVEGTSIVTITVTDNAGNSTPNPVTFAVNAAPVPVSPAPVPWNAPWALFSSAVLILLGRAATQRKGSSKQP